MKVERMDNKKQRMILTAMVVNTPVLGEIANKWDKEGLFPDIWSNKIGSWCVRYYERYAKAPRRAIEGLFESWADTNKDKTTINLIEKYLQSISSEYGKNKKPINPKYVVDLAGEYFNRIKVGKLITELQGDVDSGKTTEAFKRLNKFGKIEVGVGAGINLTQDQSAINRAFEEKRESIIKYPGDLGKFFKNELEREGFISFMGGEKKGKTWWLLDMAWRAMLQRRRVAFFEVGDLSERQIIRRFGVRAAKIPMRPQKVVIPKGIKIIDRKGDESELDGEITKEFKSGISWQEAWKAFQYIQKNKVRSKDSFFKLSVHPNSSISVNGIRSIISGWERENWIPDVVVIDYADILAPPPGFQGDSRDAINDTWKAMRRMSQELHCLVVTATQAKATAYQNNSLTMGDFSEDKRKYAHVTGMIGINQKDEEKPLGIQRLNWIVLREDEFSVKRHIYVAGCLALANPAMRSVM